MIATNAGGLLAQASQGAAATPFVQPPFGPVPTAAAQGPLAESAPPADGTHYQQTAQVLECLSPPASRLLTTTASAPEAPSPSLFGAASLMSLVSGSVFLSAGDGPFSNFGHSSILDALGRVAASIDAGSAVLAVGILGGLFFLLHKVYRYYRYRPTDDWAPWAADLRAHSRLQWHIAKKIALTRDEFRWAQNFSHPGQYPLYRNMCISGLIERHHPISDGIFEVFHAMAKLYKDRRSRRPELGYKIYPYDTLIALQEEPHIANDPRFEPVLETLASLAVESVKRALPPWRTESAK